MEWCPRWIKRLQNDSVRLEYIEKSEVKRKHKKAFYTLIEGFFILCMKSTFMITGKLKPMRPPLILPFPIPWNSIYRTILSFPSAFSFLLSWIYVNILISFQDEYDMVRWKWKMMALPLLLGYRIMSKPSKAVRSSEGSRCWRRKRQAIKY